MGHPIRESKRVRGLHFVAVMVAALVLAAPFLPAILAAPQPAALQPVRFAAVDVFIDAGDQALAAYQFELTAERGDFAIVGIEGGSHPAFQDPPYYDPAALRNHRVIIAAFNTGQNLPKGKTRVARIHVEVRGDRDPSYVVKLTAAASSKGKPIPATASVATGDPT